MNLSVTELPPYGFKFFLTENLYKLWSDDGGRSDRIATHHTDWRPQELVNMIERRLSAFRPEGSASQISLISGTGDTHEWIMAFAQDSPRNLKRILKQIVTEQLRISSGSTTISREARMAGINEFCRMRALEVAGSKALDQLRRTHHADFTVSGVAIALAVGQQSVRGYIRNYEGHGIVERVPATESPGAVGAPATSFAIQDIRVAREVFPELSLNDFIKRKIRTCINGHFVIRDWELWSGGYHSCEDCGAQVAVNQ